MPEFFMIFARKNARILRNRPNNIFPDFCGAGTRAPSPVSYAYLSVLAATLEHEYWRQELEATAVNHSTPPPWTTPLFPR